MSETINGTFSISFSTPGVSNSLLITAIPTNVGPSQQILVSGSYVGNAPSNISGVWNPGGLTAQLVAGSFQAATQAWNATFVTPNTSGSYTLTVTGTGSNQSTSAPSTTVVVVATNNFQITSLPSSANTNAQVFVTGTYAGAIPTTPSAVWNPGGFTGAVATFQAPGGGLWNALVTTPLSPGTYTLTMTGGAPNGVTSAPSASSIVVSAASGRQVIAHAQVSGLASSPITTAARDTTGAKLLVAAVSRGNVAGTFIPTDNKGNTYAPLTLRGGGFGVASQLFYVENPTVGTGHTCSLTGSGTGLAATLSFAAFDQVALSSSLDVQNGTWISSGSATMSPGTVTPSQNGVLIVTAEALDGPSATATIDSGFATTDAPAPVTPFANYGGGLAWFSQPVAAAINPTWTFASTGSSDSACSIAVFKNTAVDGIVVTTVPITISRSKTGILVGGTYQNNRPTAMTATWTGGGNASLTGFASGSGAWTATVTAPGSTGVFALTVVGTAGNTATSAPSSNTTVQIEAFVVTSVPGTGTQNALIAVSGTYAGNIPTGMTAVWNAGAITGTVSGFQVTGPGVWSANVAAPSAAATYTLTGTATGPNTTVSSPSSSIVISAVASTITITSTPAFGTTSTNVSVGFSYTGPTPTGMTAVWSPGSVAGTVSGFTASGGVGSANVLAPASANTYTLVITGTGPNTATSPASSAVSVGVPGANVLTQSFVLQNWNGSGTSQGFMRIGLASRKGDIPSTASARIQRGATIIDAQFDERTTWTDGSLKFAVCHIRDTAFSANESRTYDVYSVPSSSYNNTGTKTITDITSTHNFTVAFTGLNQTDNVSTTTVGSGAYTSNFNSQMTFTTGTGFTRLTKIHSGPVCEGWMGWGLATDNVGGATEPNLKTNWYADIWKNSDGSINSIEIGSVVAQDWFTTSAPPTRKNYDCSLKDGSTSIVSYPAVNHPYNCQWITCINDGGNNRGRRPWVGGAIPTLVYKPNLPYWIQTRLIPPYDLTITYTDNYVNSGGNGVYIPCGSADHRAGINGTGFYQGRGILANSDATAIVRQDAPNMAAGRINAHAGLGVFFHVRSNSLRTRPGETSDIANTIISLVLSNSTGVFPNYDFQSQGMPAPVDLSQRTGFGGAALGYNGVWDQGQYFDASHGVAYSAGFYLLEGERYHLEASIDLALNIAAQQPFQDYLVPIRGDPFVFNYCLASGTRPPDTTWRYAAVSQEERNWGHSIIAYGVALVPDNDIQHDAMWRFKEQQTECWGANLANQPPDCIAAGVDLESDRGDNAPFNLGVTAQSALQLGAICEDATMTAYGNWMSNYVWNNVTNNMNMLAQYRCISTRCRNYTQVIGTPGGYKTFLFNRETSPCDFYADTGTFVFRDTPSVVQHPGWYPSNGDRFISMDGNPQTGNWLFASSNGPNRVGLIELTLTQEYYFVNCQKPAQQFPSPNYPAANDYPNRSSAQVSATLGGPPISFQRANASLSYENASFTAVTASPPNNYITISGVTGFISINDVITVAGIPTGTTITDYAQGSGTPGKAGIYQISNVTNITSPTAGTTNNRVILTTAVPHGQVYFGTPLLAYAPIVVSGATPSGYNGVFTGMIVDGNHISYTLPSNPGANTVPGSYFLSGFYECDSSFASYNISGPATDDLGRSNDYMPIANMAAVMSYMSGYSAANLTGLNKIRTYMSTVDQRFLPSTAAKAP